MCWCHCSDFTKLNCCPDRFIQRFAESKLNHFIKDFEPSNYSSFGNLGADTYGICRGGCRRPRTPLREFALRNGKSLRSVITEYIQNMTWFLTRVFKTNVQKGVHQKCNIFCTTLEISKKNPKTTKKCPQKCKLSFGVQNLNFQKNLKNAKQQCSQKCKLLFSGRTLNHSKNMFTMTWKVSPEV